MWQLGREALSLGRRRAVAAATTAPGGAGRQTSFGRPPARWFCEGEPLGPPITPRPRAKAKQSSGPGKPQIAGVCLLGGVGAYVASSDVRDIVDAFSNGCGERFEDFNDASREFFERLGDRFVTQRAEPWLLELSTMKYPETIPTLVMDLDKVILHLEHDSRAGWRVIKRPHADQFFRELQHYYELVIFSDDVFPVALDIANKWNLPVTGVLHRDFCRKKRSSFVKDCSKLGRNLEKTIILDHDPAAFQLQPENGILIKPFTGDPNDSELADLLDFLKAAAQSNTDIRQFVDKFGGGDEDIGRRYLVHLQDHEKEVEARRSIGKAFASRSGFPQTPARGFGGPGSFPR